MTRRISQFAAFGLLASVTAISGAALACTRTLYVGADNTVITGRNMDWKEDMASNLWVFPAGLKRDGASGPKSIAWTSKYGSVVVSGYEVGSTDGLNERGLVAKPALSGGIGISEIDRRTSLSVDRRLGAICAR